MTAEGRLQLGASPEPEADVAGAGVGDSRSALSPTHSALAVVLAPAALAGVARPAVATRRGVEAVDSEIAVAGPPAGIGRQRTGRGRPGRHPSGARRWGGAMAPEGRGEQQPERHPARHVSAIHPRFVYPSRTAMSPTSARRPVLPWLALAIALARAGGPGRLCPWRRQRR